MVSRLLHSLDRHRHDNRCCAIRAFDQFDGFDQIMLLRSHGEAANLLATECISELGFRHIDAPDIVGEVNPVDKFNILR